ncbi:MAG: hypothetical protein ACYDER_22470 [Ktedonobacteraceae bacterium]
MCEASQLCAGASFAPTVGDSGQQSQVNLIFIVQLDLSGLRLTLQLFEYDSLASVLWISIGPSRKYAYACK